MNLKQGFLALVFAAGASACDQSPPPPRAAALPVPSVAQYRAEAEAYLARNGYSRLQNLEIRAAEPVNGYQYNLTYNLLDSAKNSQEAVITCSFTWKEAPPVECLLKSSKQIGTPRPVK